MFIVDLLQEPELVANVRSAEKDQTDEETGKIMFLLNRPCLMVFRHNSLFHLIFIAYQHSLKLIFRYLFTFLLSADPEMLVKNL